MSETNSETPRTALVTGGSEGIGFAAAARLAAAGHRVAVAARAAAGLATAAARLTAAGVPADRVLTVEMDVGSEASIRAGLERLAQRWPEIDILVNNAGLVTPPADFGPATLAALRTSLEVNLFGAVMLCQALVPGMKQRHWGRIVQRFLDLRVWRAAWPDPIRHREGGGRGIHARPRHRPRRGRHHRERGGARAGGNCQLPSRQGGRRHALARPPDPGRAAGRT